MVAKSLLLKNGEVIKVLQISLKLFLKCVGTIQFFLLHLPVNNELNTHVEKLSVLFWFSLGHLHVLIYGKPVPEIGIVMFFKIDCLLGHDQLRKCFLLYSLSVFYNLLAVADQVCTAPALQNTKMFSE